MATDRQTPCLYYVCAGLCTKGRKADHAHYCQHCNKYQPRAAVIYMDNKLLKAQSNINKLIKSSAIPLCEENEYEFKKMKEKLLIQLIEASKDI